MAFTLLVFSTTAFLNLSNLTLTICTTARITTVYASSVSSCSFLCRRALTISTLTGVATVGTRADFAGSLRGFVGARSTLTVNTATGTRNRRNSLIHICEIK